jgi:hypothetical protein
MLGALCAGVLAMGVLSACAEGGNAGGTSTPVPSAEPTVSPVVSDPPTYHCDGGEYALAALEERRPISSLDAAGREALANAQGFTDGPVELPDEDSWFVGSQTPDSLTFLRELAEPDPDLPDHDFERATIERSPEAEWYLTAWGTCPMTLDLGGLVPPEIVYVYDSPDFDPEPLELHLEVTEHACNSGQDATGRVELVRLREDEDEVGLVIGIRPRGGEQFCPGNPETPFTVTLSAPLGDRVLVDDAHAVPRVIPIAIQD